VASQNQAPPLSLPITGFTGMGVDGMQHTGPHPSQSGAVRHFARRAFWFRQSVETQHVLVQPRPKMLDALVIVVSRCSVACCYVVSAAATERKWPYWLSVTTTQAILSFLRKLDNKMPKGRAGILGSDAIGNQHNLSFIWFGNQVIWAKTAVRRQNIDFPSYDLLNEIATCELGISLAKFRRGETPSITIAQFEKIHAEFCRRYKAMPSHSMGEYPFDWTCSV
jgi:hypothetical protein